MLSECLDHATPAQVMIQVFGGHPVESSHPFFQSRVVGVRVLDVVDASQDADSLVQVHRPMGHAHLPSCEGDRAFPSPVRAKYRIPGQEGLKHRFDLPMVVLRKNRVGRRSRAIPGHQNRNLLLGEPPLCGPATPFPGSSRKTAPLSLVGSQKPGLVGFDDAAFFPGIQTGGQGQEPVSPQKSGFRVITHRQAAFRTDSLSLNFSRKNSHRSLWCSPEMDVFVNAVKMRLHPWHRKRGSPAACPHGRISG